MNLVLSLVDEGDEVREMGARVARVASAHHFLHKPADVKGCLYMQQTVAC